ncbi:MULTISPECIES: RAxF-45 family protein [Paenibacillus]|uniref:Uncharacterized protein n=2 Tax=Paenibacillus TaxID=44249 RepID=A0A919Y046_9BACL|nr:MULTISPECIES: RAxF-45 family protein [Paenibacillus]MBU5670821.1 hypothetical protein [Paenibacillus brevis]GIO42139.1 hypothetical protein J41TS4_18970 [Paenibacillus apis]
MDRNLVWNRVSQLPMALSGIVHVQTFNGISLSIFTNSISKSNCENPLLPCLTD